MKQFELSIPEPCHENWNNMTKADQGRFCAACQKTVVDFSTMSDRQLAEFFKKAPEGMCGRFQKDQLGRSIEMPRKRIPWLKYFLQVSLPALLLGTKAVAQGRVKLKPVTVQLPQVEKLTSIDTTGNKIKTVRGSVVNPKGEPLSYATIICGSHGVSADQNGQFLITIPDSMQLPVLRISSVGYQGIEVVARQSEMQFTLNEYMTGLVGEVIITKTNKKKKHQGASKKISKEAPMEKKNAAALIIYPNPAPSGSLLKMDITNFAAGEYFLSIQNESGVQFYSNDIMVVQTKSSFDQQLPVLKTGIYFITFTHKKSGQATTQKLLVQ